MAGVTVSRAWQTVKPHVPLIKFRKGGLASKALFGKELKMKAAPLSKHVQLSSSPLAAGGVSKPGGGTATKTVAPRPVYEDYQLPKKYRRAPLTEEEIACINRGGSE